MIFNTQFKAPVNHQRLIYDHEVLKDDRTLANYNIQEGTTLHLVVSVEYKIVVAYMTGNDEFFCNFTMDVVSSYTIDTLQKKILLLKGWRSGTAQRLYFAGELLQDGTRTLSDYNIQEYDVVLTSEDEKYWWENVEGATKVVSLKPECITFLDDSSKTIDQVKEAINEDMAVEFGVTTPLDQMELYFAGELLEGALKDYGFDEEKHILFLKIREAETSDNENAKPEDRSEPHNETETAISFLWNQIKICL
jgi:hypothetical protein